MINRAWHPRGKVDGEPPRVLLTIVYEYNKEEQEFVSKRPKAVAPIKNLEPLLSL